jgi:hypothetical protein
VRAVTHIGVVVAAATREKAQDGGSQLQALLGGAVWELRSHDAAHVLMARDVGAHLQGSGTVRTDFQPTAELSPKRRAGQPELPQAVVEPVPWSQADFCPGPYESA